MGHAPEKNSRLTYQEYELLEAQAEDIRYEYEAIDNNQYGEITAMTGGTKEHNLHYTEYQFFSPEPLTAMWVSGLY